MTKEELATERNEVREILEDFSEELSQSNLDKLSRVFCIINGDEKRIAELEKENTELKIEKIPQLEKRIASIRGSHRVDVKKLNARTEQVERLKRENAELKNKIRFMGEQIDNLKAIAKYDQLTKAKEIIRMVLNDVNDKNGCRLTMSIYIKAEQFLKESE